MIFTMGPLSRDKHLVIERVDKLRSDLRYQIQEPRRWSGLLRRVSFARAIQGSNSIEGYNATLEDAVAAVEQDEPLEASGVTWQATVGYRNAMTYVLQLADDPYSKPDSSLIRSLHYMLIQYDLDKMPGRWRNGPIFVHDGAKGVTVYEGPPANELPELMDQLTESLAVDDDRPAVVRAAMAHLNLVMIHPFKDGNGRMARVLQSLVLSKDGILAPEFCSIEEYLGRNTQDYYDVLAEVGRGSYQPQNDPRPWVRFTLTAHYRQALRLLRRVTELEGLFNEIERLIESDGLDTRSVPALAYAASGRRLRRSNYTSLADVSDSAGSRDLRTLVDAGYLIPHGEKRGRFYVASDQLKEVRAKTRAPGPRPELVDPFEDILQQELPFGA